jgi:hypothetical protein
MFLDILRKVGKEEVVVEEGMQDDRYYIL